MNIRLTLNYMGTAYHGWQRQQNAATIQATLEDAFAALTGHHSAFIGCGRTDAGVHARGYVANTRAETSIPMEKLPLALNAKLPRDISVYRAEQVSEDFHAVFSCVGKEYTYTIQNGRVRNPFLNDRAMFIPAELDRAAMAQCAAEFVGTHDFAAVRSLGSNVKTTVRTVFDCEVGGTEELITVRIKASGFLYNMARAMAGTLVYAGLHKLQPGDITEILKSGDRRLAGPTLEPGGLCMTGVWYEE
ncbi:MAG: tRNA pseudouridine(38-40) synthase TruA [Ruminococcaceae bacterium]|nr:tRNA pseudouridine(38-40) synthase TruA [Oscillospiraceae bacterium]